MRTVNTPSSQNQLPKLCLQLPPTSTGQPCEWSLLPVWVPGAGESRDKCWDSTGRAQECSGQARDGFYITPSQANNHSQSRGKEVKTQIRLSLLGCCLLGMEDELKLEKSHVCCF